MYNNLNCITSKRNSNFKEFNNYCSVLDGTMCMYSSGGEEKQVSITSPSRPSPSPHFSSPFPVLSGFQPSSFIKVLTAILYMFVTQPHPPINKLAIVMVLSWQPLVQTEEKASLPGMGVQQGARTVFSTYWCIGGEKQPSSPPTLLSPPPPLPYSTPPLSSSSPPFPPSPFSPSPPPSLPPLPLFSSPPSLPISVFPSLPSLWFPLGEQCNAVGGGISSQTS